MKKLLLILLLAISCASFAQQINYVELSYGRDENSVDSTYYQLSCFSDLNYVFYNAYGGFFHNRSSGKQRASAENKYSKAIFNIDKPTLEQYVDKSLNDYKNINNEVSKISKGQFKMVVVYSDCSKKLYRFPAILYLLSEFNIQTDKQNIYMNNLFFTIASYYFIN